MSETIAALMSPDQYRESRSHLFPSRLSFDWYIRQHRVELLEAGALFIIAGKTRVDGPRCDAVVMDVGRAAAMAAGKRANNA